MFGKSNSQPPDLEFFTIFDAKVGHYRQPLMAINQFDILRQAESVMRKGDDIDLFNNAEDFQLFKIGSFDKSTGRITSHQPEHIANLHEIKSSVQRSQKQQVGISGT